MYAGNASTSTFAPPTSTPGAPFHLSNLMTVKHSSWPRIIFCYGVLNLFRSFASIASLALLMAPTRDPPVFKKKKNV
jgi:hypothetical protein